MEESPEQKYVLDFLISKQGYEFKKAQWKVAQTDWTDGCGFEHSRSAGPMIVCTIKKNLLEEK